MENREECGGGRNIFLITRRSQVQILAPLPNKSRGYGENRSPFLYFPTNRIIDLMKTLEDIKSTLLQHRKDMSENFHVRVEAKEDSDVDIIVTFSAPIGLFKFISLEEYLEGLLGLKADLVSKDALKPRIGARILKEVVYA